MNRYTKTKIGLKKEEEQLRYGKWYKKDRKNIVNDLINTVTSVEVLMLVIWSKFVNGKVFGRRNITPNG